MTDLAVSTIQQSRSYDAPLAAASAIRRGTTSFASRARSERRGTLSINQTAVLGQLAKFGETTPTEIADRMQTQLQSLTRTLAWLESEEMLKRVPDPSDRRQSVLSITEAGTAALRDEMRPRDEWVAHTIAANLTPTEIDLLVLASGLLERLAYLDASSVPSEP